MKVSHDPFMSRPHFDLSLPARRDSRRFAGDRAFVTFQKRVQRRASRHVGAVQAIAEGLEEVYLDSVSSLDQELFEESLADLFEALRKRMGWPF